MNPPVSPQPTSRTLAIGIVVIGLLTACALAWPLARLFVHYPIDINEGWNALLADRAMGRDVLYPSMQGTFFNNYPPLSFYVVGLAGRLTGDNIIAGRLISLAAILVIAFNIGWIVRSLGGARGPSILAGILFIATMAKSFAGYTAMDDPQLLAQAVMSFGFALFCAAPRRMSHVAAAAAIMVAAGFIKHNILAMPLAVTLWLLQYDRRVLLRWIALGLVLVAAGFAVCWLAYGADFFHQLMGPRVYNGVHVVLKSLGRIQAFVIPLILWIAVAVQLPPDPRLRMVTDLIVAGAAAYALTQGGSGVAWNCFFDWLIGACVGLGVALSRIGETRFVRRHGLARAEALVILALALRLILLPPSELLHLSSALAALNQKAAAMAGDVDFLRAQPGQALCEDLAVCYWSGHQSLLDGFGTSEVTAAGWPNIRLLEQRIARGEVPLLQLNHGSPFAAPAAASGLYRRRESPNSIFFYR
jgi:hypothetical protein